MRVVHVSLDPGVPVFGGKGCSVHVQEVLRVFVAAGHDVHVVTTRPGGPPAPGLEVVTVHHVELPPGRSQADRELDLVVVDDRVGKVVEELLTGVDDALVYERYALFACAAQETARRHDVPSVLEVNAPLPLEQARHRGLHDTAGADGRTARAFAAASRIVAVSSQVGAWVHAVEPGADVLVVPNGVDVDRFVPVVRPREPLLRIAFVGAFRPWHGVDLLVEAVGRLQALPGQEVELVLIGDGPGRPAALDRIAELGIRCDAVGALDPAQVPGELARADVAVAPYPAGGAYFSPLKVAEYLACGVATVASAVGDLAATYADGHELLLTPAGDVESLTAALQRLRVEDDLRADLAAQGRRAVEQRGTWNHVVARSVAGLELRAEVAA